jgi:hypothetical protein
MAELKTHACQTAFSKVIQVTQPADLVHWRKFAVQRNGRVHLALRRTQLGLHAGEIGVAVFRDEVHRIGRTFEDDCAHLFRLFDRAHLGRHQIGLGGAGTGDQQQCHSGQLFESHERSPFEKWR